MSEPAAMLPENRPMLLFVDDEKRVLTSMRALFRREYQVLVANSGAEALKVLDASVDVVISDQRMPEMTGVEMLSEAKRGAPQTARILMTGQVFRFLLKPIQGGQCRIWLNSAINKVLGGDADTSHPGTDATSGRRFARWFRSFRSTG
ncbi:MAG: response regulator [Gammaproteobacteria bacterium]|nr:response regulator [Gammaproteobacteria bacterium]